MQIQQCFSLLKKLSLLKRSSNVVGDSNDENNFPHKLLLRNTQVSRLVKLLQIILQQI